MFSVPKAPCGEEQAVIFRLDVLVTAMHGNNHVCANAVDQRVERIHLALDFRDRRGLRLLPTSVRSLPTHAVNPIMRVLPIRLVDATDLQIHNCSHPL